MSPSCFASPELTSNSRTMKSDYPYEKQHHGLYGGKQELGESGLEEIKQPLPEPEAKDSELLYASIFSAV